VIGLSGFSYDQPVIKDGLDKEFGLLIEIGVIKLVRVDGLDNRVVLTL
jgi:hypothetical protein